MPSRNPAAITRYKPALGGGERKFNTELFDALTMLAHNKASVPITREENDTTIRSLSLGSSTNRNCEINSTRSMAAQRSTSVNGFSAVTARMPNALSSRMPIQLTGLGKLSRATAVMITLKQIVPMLSANAHEIPSATNKGV